MALNQSRGPWVLAALLIISGFLISCTLVTGPALIVEMSSTAESVAQAYYDTGSAFNEPDSATAKVTANQEFHPLRLELPRKTILKLRFDPLKTAGTVEIRNMRIVDTFGLTLREIPPSAIKAFTEIKELTQTPDGIRVRTIDNSIDSALLITWERPLPLSTPMLVARQMAALTLVNLPFWLAAWIAVSPRRRALVAKPFIALDARFRVLASSISSPAFIAFDRLAIWFYMVCAAFFFLNVACDLNGSSMEFNTRAFHQYGPQTVIAGEAKAIRSDEWNFLSPYMFYQAFRPDHFEAKDTPFGNYYTALMGNVPVKHITTLFRPQYWGFFVLPLDYGFSFYWQMKWLWMVTGVFTLLLAMTRSSWLSIGGSLWLYYSDFTQWTFSWPSMLPEICGTFCFVVVLAMYLTVGRNRWALSVCSLLLAMCMMNFAMCAYVPHLVPYVWAALFLFGAWVYTRKYQILAPEWRVPRGIALGAALVLVGLMLASLFHDDAPSIAGIGATYYPGHRVVSGGEFQLVDFASHFFGEDENEGHFPPRLGNVCEAAGFFWLAPVTLLCWGAIRRLSREQRSLLICLWVPLLLLAGWDLLPIPASIGKWLMLDKVYPQRSLPAMGFLNMAIVMMVLSAPPGPKKLGLDMRMLICAGAVFLGLATINSQLGGLFTFTEVLVSATWLSILVALLWDMRPRLFLVAALAPSLYFFGMINPVSRGIGAVTNSELFRFTEAHRQIRNGKWLVISPEHFFGIFAACGLNSYLGMHYLPRMEDFHVFQAHGVDTRNLNAGGTLIAKPLKPGEKSTVSAPVLGAQEWNIDPTDPLIEDLGIRYVAFDRKPEPEMLTRLRPLSDSPVSGFWLYEVRE